MSSNDDAVTESAPVGQLSPVDSLLDLIRNLIPANIVYATFAQVQTWRTVTAVTFDCSNEVDASITNYDHCASSKNVYELNDPNSGFVKKESCPYQDVSLFSNRITI